MFSKVKKHLSDNVDLYVAATAAATIAVVGMHYFGRPKIEVVKSAGVINAFIAGAEAAGARIYVLDAVQENLYQGALAAAAATMEVAG